MKPILDVCIGLVGISVPAIAFEKKTFTYIGKLALVSIVITGVLITYLFT